jgi:single-strand DNA-binding protein
MSSYSMGIVLGNLVADPEMRYLQSGTAVTSMTVAVNYKIPGRDGGEARDEASFFDVTVFGKQAENCSQYLHKGSSVLVEGRLKQDRWEKDGQKRSKIIIVANAVRFVGPKQDRSKEREPGEEEASGSGGAGEDIPF